ncbi:MAG: mercury(II) reductase [Alphaproteobacteria bacterium]|nr:MAG: mercury(II) reductase [Alphaproteobacteria bacterium]
MSDHRTVEAAITTYDIAVIGAGSAGFSAAITAADQGAKVALIGHGTLGGTCVNVGCVPSKTMIRMAEALHGARTAERFAGIVGEAHVTDWRRVVADKDALVTTLRNRKYRDLLPDYQNVTYLEGRARLTPSGVQVAAGEITAAKVIITTGSSPALPDIPGLAHVPYLTSTTALELTELPRSMMILGGGYIGCELAQMFARAGVRVTLVTRRRLLPEAEPEVATALTGFFEQEGIMVRTGLSYQRVDKAGEGVSLEISVSGNRETLTADYLLLTTGRRPNSSGLGLEDAGIDLLANGGIVVDDHLRTSNPTVYAAGDVTGRDQYVYMAAYGAKLAALNALKGDSLAYDNSVMPWVVFTDPQIAGVGLTEAAAKSAGLQTKTSLLPLDQLPRALAARDMRGLIKLVADGATDRLLGAQIIAPEGADSIQTAVMAIRHGMTTRELGEMIFPYLTTVEGLKLAAQGFGKDITKLSCCAG